ncbi:nitroreductase family protein [Paenibacillus vulneris]|uniref:Nitroreductase family protein n=1 Tax=Paenibacillus vulneris TaxID=1133364 RepID=A0ABW3UNB3_9BACL
MSHTEQHMTAEETIQSRRSVRQFQPGVSIPEAELNEILSLAASAPSSWNLQHWRFLVVTEQANKERLLPITYNQKQTVDASVVVVVLGDLQANLVAPTVYGQATEQIRDLMLGQINSAYENNPVLARDEAIRNASLAAMQLMLAAKAKGYDTVPMGGYDRDALIKELNIPDRYVPVMVIPIGKAAVPGRPTDRLPLEQQVIRESF